MSDHERLIKASAEYFDKIQNNIDTEVCAIYNALLDLAETHGRSTGQRSMTQYLGDAMHQCGVRRGNSTNVLGVVLMRLKEKFGDNMIFSAQFSDNGSDEEDADNEIPETYDGLYDNITVSLSW